MGLLNRVECKSLILGLCLILSLPPVALALTEEELIRGAREEGKLLWYTSSPTQEAESLAAAFQKKYNVKAEFVRLGGLATVQKVFAEQERGVRACDVVGPTGATDAFPQLKRRGWLAKLADLPEWSAIPNAFKDKDGTYIFINSDAVGMIYNKQALGNLPPPKKVKELADPKWKDKIVVGDPTISGTAVTWGRFILQHPQLGTEFLEALRRNNVLIVGQTGQITDSIARGGRVVAAMQQEYEYVKIMDKGVGWVTPEEGFVITPRPGAIPLNAPHPKAARLFLNFMLGLEAQDVMLKNGNTPARKDMDHRKYMNWKPDLRQGWQPDWESITEQNSKEAIEKISKALRGR